LGTDEKKKRKRRRHGKGRGKRKQKMAKGGLKREKSYLSREDPQYGVGGEETEQSKSRSDP